jgi:hypothetical protein
MPEDLASDLRKKEPFTLATLLNAFAPWTTIRQVARMSLAIGHLSNYNDVVSFAMFLLCIPLCAATFLASDGRFGQTQLIAGSAALLWNWLFFYFFFAVGKLISRLFYVGVADENQALSSLP